MERWFEVRGFHITGKCFHHCSFLTFTVDLIQNSLVLVTSLQLGHIPLHAPACSLLFTIQISTLFISSERVHNHHALPQDCCSRCFCTREPRCCPGPSSSIHQDTYQCHRRSTSRNSVHCAEPSSGKRCDLCRLLNHADVDKPATIVLRKGDPSNLMDVSTLTSKFR